MALLIRGEIPATADQYDQIQRQLGLSEGNLPEGLISHVAAGPTVVESVNTALDASERLVAALRPARPLRPELEAVRASRRRRRG